MAVARIKCSECDNMILPETAAANRGLCGQCAKIPEWIRRSRREFEDKVASGAWFTPSSNERQAAKQLPELGDATEWEAEPEFYKDRQGTPIRDIIQEATAQTAGHVFLVSSSGARLNLSFNGDYGVCEYQNEESGDYLYAYSPENLREQVPPDQHLDQACACCGVGMGWYPSRFHMPRRTAFAVLSAAALKDSNALDRVVWLPWGDVSYTTRGHG